MKISPGLEIISRYILVLLFISGFRLEVAHADEGLFLLYGDEEIVSIATGLHQPITKAPSTATIITAEDIKAMGASNA